jgi:hypothetical protein
MTQGRPGWQAQVQLLLARGAPLDRPQDIPAGAAPSAGAAACPVCLELGHIVALRARPIDRSSSHVIPYFNGGRSNEVYVKKLLVIRYFEVRCLPGIPPVYIVNW